MAGVVILAAGFGTRLKEVGENTPKGLLGDEEALLERLVVDLEGTEDIEGVALVTNDKFYGQYKKWLEGKFPKAKIKVINDRAGKPEDRLGALGDLKVALEEMSWWEKEAVLVLPSDTLYSFRLAELLDFYKKHDDGFVTVVRELEDKSDIEGRLGCAVMEQDRVVAFEEKPKNAPSNFAAIPFYVYPKKMLVLIKEYEKSGGDLDAPGSIIPWLIKRGVPVYAMVTKGETIDVGRPEDLERLNKAS